MGYTGRAIRYYSLSGESVIELRDPGPSATVIITTNNVSFIDLCCLTSTPILQVGINIPIFTDESTGA